VPIPRSAGLIRRNGTPSSHLPVEGKEDEVTSFDEKKGWGGAQPKEDKMKKIGYPEFTVSKYRRDLNRVKYVYCCEKDSIFAPAAGVPELTNPVFSNTMDEPKIRK
jgi:hypothetical protein